MTAATTADPVALLVLIVVILASFCIAGLLIEARGRWEDEFTLRPDTVERLTSGSNRDRGWREARP